MSPKNAKKLAEKKYRNETGLFLVEGEKSIRELLGSDLVVEDIFGANTFLGEMGEEIRTYEKRNTPHAIALMGVTEEDLARMGTLMTNNAGIAVARQRKEETRENILAAAKANFVLALADVRDPGNLGTIIRIADWFGVKHIVASPTTTDCYNPKTVAATMGSFTRTTVTYLPLADLLQDAKNMGIEVIGAELEGKSLYGGKLPRGGVLVMGSESHGIGDDLSPFITQKLTIPKYGGAESLNVSVATGILLSALKNDETGTTGDTGSF